MAKPKILYVEDDETLSFVTKDNLEINGFDVFHYMDGESAINAFMNNKFDLCIFDVMMPRKDGFTLAKEVRERDQQVPIIFLTAKTMKDDVLQGFKIGADDYFTKPLDFGMLKAKLLT